MYLPIHFAVVILLVQLASVCRIAATAEPFSSPLERAVVRNKTLCDAVGPEVEEGSIAEHSAFGDITVLATMHYKEWQPFWLAARLAIGQCSYAGKVNLLHLKDKVKKASEPAIKMAILVLSCFKGYAASLCGEDIDLTSVLHVSDRVGVLEITLNFQPIYALADDVVRYRFGANKGRTVGLILQLVMSYVECYLKKKVSLHIPWLPAGDFNIPIFSTHLVGVHLPLSHEAERNVTFGPFIAPCLEDLTVHNGGLTAMPWELPSLHLLDVRNNPALSMAAFKDLNAPMLADGRVFLSSPESPEEEVFVIMDRRQ